MPSTRSVTAAAALLLAASLSTAALAAARRPQCPGSRPLLQVAQRIDTLQAADGPVVQRVHSLLLLCTDGTATLSSNVETPAGFPFVGAVDTGKVAPATLAQIRAALNTASFGLQQSCSTAFNPGTFSPYQAEIRWYGTGQRTNTFVISAPAGSGPRCSQAVMDAFALAAYSSASAVHADGSAAIIAPLR